MKVLLDTNVVLDALLDRKPWSRNASRILAAVERGEVEGLLGATTVTTIFYLARKTVGTEAAKAEVRWLLSLFAVAPVHRPVLEDAVGLHFHDFEDALLDTAAGHAGADAIVTRNLKDFEMSRLPVLTPEELLGTLYGPRASG